MVIFRENTEDIYAGIEFASGSVEAKEIIEYLNTKGLGKNVSSRIIILCLSFFGVCVSLYVCLS